MYNYYQPQNPISQQQMYGMGGQRQNTNYNLSLKGRPVSSIDEVRSIPIDFDGSIFYFPDLANNRIYTKQINIDGTASLSMYELKPIEQQLTTDYITRKEFEETISRILNQQQASVPKEEKPKITTNF